MDRATAFVCSECGDTVDVPTTHTCHSDDPNVRLVHDEDRVRERFDPVGSIDDHWRYAPLFPTDRQAAVSLGEGGTTLTGAPTLSDDLGVDLLLKREGANPTGSTKDRGTSLLVSHARKRGASGVACASTGNAAASLAAYAARASLPAHIFVPEDLSGGKATQPRVYGAEVTRIAGSYDDAHRQCHNTVAERDWADRSAGASPFTAAGARTLGYEIVDEADPIPDWVVIPMGNGGTLTDAYRGLETFTDLGLTPETPKMLGVQSAANSPIHDGLQGDGGAVIEGRATRADSIDVHSPRRATEARQALRDSGGASVTVPEDAIEDAITRLGSSEGVFAEPASAATIAAIDQARGSGLIDRGDRVVAVITGTGLKDADAARHALDAAGD